MATKLTKADKAFRAVEKLAKDFEETNIVHWYLDGDHVSKKIVIKRLKEHRVQIIKELHAVDRILELLPDCPETM